MNRRIQIIQQLAAIYRFDSASQPVFCVERPAHPIIPIYHLSRLILRDEVKKNNCFGHHIHSNCQASVI